MSSSSSSSSSSCSSSSFSSSSSASADNPQVPTIYDNIDEREERAAVNIGLGGGWDYGDILNVLGEDSDDVYTERTGVGVGQGYTGSQPTYLSVASESSSCSCSSSSMSPFSSSSSSCSSSSNSVSCSSSFSSSSSSSAESPSSSSSSFSSSSSSSQRAASEGYVFFTGVAPTGAGNVGDEVYSDGEVLVSFSTDTDLVTLNVLAGNGFTHYIPVVTINGVAVSDFTRNAYGDWEGTIAVDLDGAASITAIHEDGPTYTTTVSAATGPTVTDLTFANGYPGSQTELKENDTFDVTVTTNKDFDQIYVYNYEAAQVDTVDVGDTSSHTFSATIANRGSGTYSDQTIKIKVRDASNGFWSEDYVATTFHATTDGEGVVQLNNDYPVISSIAQGNIDYPVSQEALKNSEQATVNHTITVNSGVFTTAYTSPNGDLSITNDTTYETAKTAQRISGSYNIGTTNFRIVATKTTNNAQTTRNAVVYIANTAMTLTVSTATARLRSGGNAGTSAQNHTITITGNQRLIEAPTLVAPEGTWQGGGFAGSGTTWTRSLQVHDDDPKGTHNWGDISATNLAGIETTTINTGTTYVFGGFVSRTLTIDAWPNREADIGTYVTDTAKLTCENLSKGGGGPNGGTIFTYDSDTDDETNKFTITDPTTVANPDGYLWYNKDLSNAVSNTTGTAEVIIEETV